MQLGWELLFCLVGVRSAPAGGPAQWHEDGHGAHLHHHPLQTPLPGVEPPSGGATPFPLSSVRLTRGSAFYEAQELNTAYLRYLDLERLLHTFRFQAGLPNPAPAYGGWESPSYQWGLLNGHFTGHLLSALAFAAAAGEAGMAAKGARLVAELANCQAAIASASPHLSGWLSAYGIDQLERLEAHNLTRVWAPYYTVHKLCAGLYDQHVHAGSAQALTVLVRLADFLVDRIRTLISRRGRAWWQECLATEFGGMNDVAYSLYGLTANRAHLELATYFSPDAFFDPLAAGVSDPLEGLHANQHLPIVVGAARGYELTANGTLANVTANFDCLLAARYSYTTGGSSVDEHWSSPRQLGASIQTLFNETTHAPRNSVGYHTQETCTTYNALKLARHLVGWSTSIVAADAYETRLLNGILGTQQPGVLGSMSYMTPLGRGVSRDRWDWYGFGSPNNSFWCCYGTSVESFAKLGDSIYWYADGAHLEQRGTNLEQRGANLEQRGANLEQRGANLEQRGANWTAGGMGGPPVLFVSQFIPSTLRWEAVGLELEMRAQLELDTTRGGTGRAREGRKGSPNPSPNPSPSPHTSHTSGRKGTGQLDAALVVSLVIGGMRRTGSLSSTGVELRVRVPGWAAAGSVLTVHPSLSDAGLPHRSTPLQNGTWCVVPAPAAGWREGDVVEATLRMRPRLERINDVRGAYGTVGSVMLGPLVLAALTNESDVLRANPSSAAQWVVPRQAYATADRLSGPTAESLQRDGGRQAAPSAARCGTAWAIWGCEGARGDESTVELVAVGQVRNYTLLPLGRVAHQNYTAYLNVSLNA